MIRRLKYRRLIIRSRNNTAALLREKRIPTNGPVIYRLGSLTPTIQITSRTDVKEINTVESCKISNNKILMKQMFDELEVPTAKWTTLDDENIDLKYPLIVKHRHSSGGRGIYFINNKEELNKLISDLRIAGKAIKNHIVEEYKTYTREYRIHVTKDGIFHASRKMLKNDSEVRWHRHGNNSIWIKEDNELFDKPKSWDKIEEGCIKALEAIKADICAVDIKVQSNDKEDPKFIVLETNTAPALGENTALAYEKELLNLINK